MPARCPTCSSTANSAARTRSRSATGSTRSRFSQCPAIRTFAAPPFSRSSMSHHFDYTADERLDISDAYCFAGPSDAFGPRTVFGMNASPNDAGPWDPAGYYELKVDTNEDLVEDITWRFTFPLDSAGVQHVVVAELTGRQATDRNAKGRIITPPHAPVGDVLEVERGIKIFAGPRTDSFFNFLPFPITLANALNEGFFPDLAALFPATDFFMNQIVRSVLVEAPAEVTGRRRVNYWAPTAIHDQGHGWVSSSAPGGPTARPSGTSPRVPLGSTSTPPSRRTTSRAGPATPTPTPPPESGARSGTRPPSSSGLAEPTTRGSTAGPPRWPTVRTWPTSSSPWSSRSSPAPTPCGTPGRAATTARASPRTHSTTPPKSSSTRTSSPALPSPRNSSTTSPTSPHRPHSSVRYSAARVPSAGHGGPWRSKDRMFCPCRCPSGNSSRISQRHAATIASTSRRHSASRT